MDTLSPEERSRVMSAIRSRDTAPEMVVRRALWAAYLSYRRGFWRAEDERAARYFTEQVDSAAVYVNDSTRITELKDGETRDEAIEKFFERLNDHFDKDYYAEVKEDTDNNFQYMLFFVIAADDATGTETQLVSEFEILFAEKDGKYYVFG